MPRAHALLAQAGYIRQHHLYAFQVDVLLLTRRSLFPTHWMYDTGHGLVELEKMSQWG
jgi:hypothetical protein